jgi:protoporphyrinogen oxidase
MTEDIRALGGQVLLETKATKLEFEGDRCVRVHAGDQVFEPSAVISSLPLRNTVGMSEPRPGSEVMAAAKGLRYRDFLTVAVVLNGEDLFPDNWIYIHDPNVNVGRIQNFRSWSPAMVPDPSKACVGLEFFCFAGDKLWESDDDDLVRLGMRELEQLGLARADQLEFGFVERVPKAYPMYDADYSERVHAIRSWLDGLDNFIQVGRNGLHRYNNSDHSSLTAMRAVDNLVKGTDHDIWAVNAESVYHEEGKEEEDEQPYIEAPETESMKEPLHS